MGDQPADANAVLRWDAVNSAWAQNVQSGMTRVAAHGADIAWGLDDGGNNYMWDGSKRVKKGCCVVQMSAGVDGELWATDPGDQNRVLRWNGAAWDTHTLNAPIPPGMREVAVGSASQSWALDHHSSIYRWNGSGWQKIPGALKGLAVGPDGAAWGVDETGPIYRFVP